MIIELTDAQLFTTGVVVGFILCLLIAAFVSGVIMWLDR